MKAVQKQPCSSASAGGGKWGERGQGVGGSGKRGFAKSWDRAAIEGVLEGCKRPELALANYSSLGEL